MAYLGKSPWDNSGQMSWHIVPDKDAQYDIGSATQRIRDIYVEGSVIGAIFDLANNQYLQSLNAAGTAYLGLIKADTSNNTVVNAATGKDLLLAINGTTKWRVNSSGNLKGANGTSLLWRNVADSADLTVLTTDASDNTVLNGASGKEIDFQIGAVTKWRIDSAFSLDGPNNIFLQFRNAANSAYLSVLKADASDNTVLNAATGKEVQFQINAVTKWRVDSSFSLDGPNNIYLQFRNAADSSYIQVLKVDASDATWLNSTTGTPIIFGRSGVEQGRFDSSGNLQATTGNVVVNTAGKTLTVKSGANAKAGTVTVNGATGVVVNTTAITANSVIEYGLKTVGGTPGGKPYESAVSVGTSFTVKATAGDTSTYNWVIIDLV